VHLQAHAVNYNKIHLNDKQTYCGYSTQYFRSLKTVLNYHNAMPILRAMRQPVVMQKKENDTLTRYCHLTLDAHFNLVRSVINKLTLEVIAR